MPGTAALCAGQCVTPPAEAGAPRADHSTQWNALPDPLPVHADAAHPVHDEHWVPLGHCESLVHQHGTPAAVQAPDAEDTLSQLPIEHDQAFAALAAVWQSSLSAVPVPEHMPAGHWLSLLTHLPLEQFESATQRHAVFALFRTGGGVSDVTQLVPPAALHATELGAGMHPFPSSCPVPVQPAQLPLCELGMQRPLGHPRSEMQ
jgi:hypothetical protein